jgi:Uma2 family endonuclease
MGTTALISVEEYLTTSYRDGDRDYLDGQVVERNVGENRHSRIQGLIVGWFLVHYKRFWCGPECRVRIRPARYRIPDITLLTGKWPTKPGPIMEPPFLVVEVLSPDDRPGEMQERIADYRACGVQFIWVVDPIKQSGEIYTAKSNYPASDGVLRTENPVIEVPLAALFETEPAS